MAHGGAVASALDDILGTMVWREMGFWRAGIPTIQLNVRYRATTPMGRQLRFDTYIVEREGRKVCRFSSNKGNDNRVFAENLVGLGFL